jgi:hypothetical protein
MNFAHRKAESVAEVLYDMKPVLPENLAKVAATNGLALKRTVPFEENTGPTDLDAGMNFTKAAFALSEEEPLTESPIRDGDNFFLLAFDKKLPSEIQPLEKVRDRVIADYKQEQAVQLARRAGNQFAEAVTNGMAKGKTFAAIAADAKIKPVTVPSISYGTRILPEVEDHVSLFEFKRVAFNTPVGKTSNFVETENGGMVVYVRQLLPIDEAKMKADLPGFLRTVHQVRRQETINNWFQREASKALRDTPLSQPSPTGPPGAGPRRS